MHKVEIILGAAAMEITAIPTGSNATELLAKVNISAVFPVTRQVKPSNSNVFYSAPSSPFAIGDQITGATSGATGTITGFIGTTGLELSDVVGDFIPGENIIYNVTYPGVGTALAPGTWNGVTGATSGSGTGISFDVTDVTGVYDTITIVDPGVGYEIGDTITILGTDLGGATPANDLVITVTGDSAAVDSENKTSYDGEWIYPFPTMTVIQVQMNDGSRMNIELQNVDNHSDWNDGSLAALQKAIADINAWL